jgi:DNA-binding response OmpR family regulator
MLIVEDTHDIGNAMKEYLVASGYTVTRVTTLEECYKVIKKEHFDCVIMDRMLPDGEGIQACHEIKSYKNIPVIMETAKGQLEDKVQ